MTIKKVFKSTQPSIQYCFKNGKIAAFANFEYATELESEIAELQAEIGEEGQGKSRHPHLYVDPDKAEIDTEAMDPLEVIRKKAVEEYIKTQARAMNASKNVSSYDNSVGNKGMVTTATIAEAMSDSDSGAAQNTATEAGAGAGGNAMTAALEALKAKQ